MCRVVPCWFPFLKRSTAGTAGAAGAPHPMEREEQFQPVVMEFEHALGYVQAVKQTLSPTAYTQFLDILRAYREDWCVSPCGLGPL